MSEVDVVVVSYNSSEHLRACVEPLAGLRGVNVIVVDNASTDGSLGTVRDLPLTAIARSSNGGFATGCNAGWRAGSAPFVLFLNPDATIDESSLRRLSGVLEANRGIGVAAPRIEHPDGSLAFSQRRFPTIRSTYAQALFLHRIFPRSRWSDEVVRDAALYRQTRNPEWVSGACMLIRRSVLEKIEGWDEGYFLYCEDIDICRRIGELGLLVQFEPGSIVVHHGGESAPQATTIPILARSRMRYARLNRRSAAAVGERIGIGLGALTHLVVSRGGLARRLAYARAFAIVVSPEESGTS